MIIKDIQCIRIRTPYHYDVNYQNIDNDNYNAAKFKSHELESLIIKITTDNGLIGWGEAFGHACNSATLKIINKLLIPFFQNKNCDNHLELMKQANYAFHSYGRGGTLFYALSAFDIALWDIAAKRENVPLYKLIGGKPNNVRLYPSLPCYDGNVAILKQQLNKLYHQGYRYIKLHETDVDSIIILKHFLPNDLEIMVDVNCAYSDENALTLLTRLKQENIYFIEEPIFPPESWSKLAELKHKSGIDIAVGENVNNLNEFENIINHNSANILQPSVCKIGGITPILKLIELTKNKLDIQILPHCYFYGPGMLATAHIVACLGQKCLLEVPYLMFEQHLYPILDYKPNFQLPYSAGLGFEPNDQILQNYSL